MDTIKAERAMSDAGMTIGSLKAELFAEWDKHPIQHELEIRRRHKVSSDCANVFQSLTQALLADDDSGR